MRLAIMQPYFLPYIGYFQLISAVDSFVVYDNIKYTKRGWINRNRLLLNGQDALFSLPLQAGSDSLEVVERRLAADFDRRRLLNQLKGAYGRAPYFTPTFQLLEEIVHHEDNNLFGFIFHSIQSVCRHLDLQTEILISSSIVADHTLKKQDKVLALCQALGCTSYTNPIGGLELYSKDAFQACGIELKFLRSRPLKYEQFGERFIPYLSIVDVLMFNPLDTVRDWISHHYELL